MEMGDNGKEGLLVESLFNLHSRKSSCVTADQGSKPTEEGKTSHPSTDESVSVFALPHYGPQEHLETCRTVLGYHRKETVQRMPKTNVFKRQHERFSNDQVH